MGCFACNDLLGHLASSDVKTIIILIIRSLKYKMISESSNKKYNSLSQNLLFNPQFY